MSIPRKKRRTVWQLTRCAKLLFNADGVKHGPRRSPTTG